MTPDQVLDRLKLYYPHLDWQSSTVPGLPYITEYDGRARDEQGTPILFVRHWGERPGCSTQAIVWVCGSPRPQFLSIEAALEWLEWLQGAMARA